MPIDPTKRHMPLGQFTQAPSGYRAALGRFESILTDKLGIKKQTPTQTVSQTFSPVNTTPTNGMQDVRATSGNSAAAIDKAFSGTPLTGLGRVFKTAEQAYGVNAYFLAAVAAHESDYGRSQIAKDKNNLFGFGASDDSPYDNAHTFETTEKGVFEVASFLSSAYLNENGPYYEGVSVDAVGKRYATDPQWSEKVSTMINQIKAHEE